MEILDEPHFMKNDEWYYFDEEKRRYMLTDKAPQKAVISYEEFYDESICEEDEWF